MKNGQFLKRFHSILPSFLQTFIKNISDSPIGRRLALGSFWSLFGALTSRGLMLISSIFVARCLGKESFGEFGIIRSTVGMVEVFAGFGLGLTATKYVAKYRIEDPVLSAHMIKFSERIATITGLLMAVIFFASSSKLARDVLAAPHLAPFLRIISFTLIIAAIHGVQNGALAGFEDFRAIAQLNIIAGCFGFLFMVIGAFCWKLDGAVWAVVFGMIVRWLLFHITIRKKTGSISKNKLINLAIGEWSILLKFSLPALLSGVMASPAIWLCNAILVNQRDGYSEMALLSAASQWRLAIQFIPDTIGAVALPMLSSLIGTRRSGSYRKVLSYNLGLNSGTAIIVALPIILFSRLIMKSYGDGFEKGNIVLIFLSIAAVLASINNVIGYALASLEKMWLGFVFNLLWAIVLIISVSLLIGYGATGIAVATVIAYFLHSVWQGGYVFYMTSKIDKS